MDMPARKYGADGRYGFNGKERDKDMYSLTAYDYGFRIYNPAIGKFLSVDPLTQSYPWYTPYQFAGNTPIQAIDLDGLEEFLPLMRGLSIPEPILSFPKAPTIPIPVQPLPPIVPPQISMPQAPTAPLVPAMPNAPITPLIPRKVSFDESTIDPNDATTYPTPPESLKGDWKVTPIKPGTKGYEKLKEKGATRLENEKGDLLRWHAPDKYHPKGHWDFKAGGNDKNPWENYTPDGIKIPDGKIYGKDFNPAVSLIFDFDITTGVQYIIPTFLRDKYEQFKEKMREYNIEKRLYDEKMKEYQKKMKEYEKKMKNYEEKFDKYHESCKLSIIC